MRAPRHRPLSPAFCKAALATVSLALLPWMARASAPPGVWIWTRRDLEMLGHARAVDPRVRAAIHVGTLRVRGGTLGWDRALSPAIDHDARALVVRLDDSVHSLWNDASPADVAARLSPLLGEILGQVLSTGATPDEIELDYDAPVRVVAAWAQAAGILAAGPLRGRAVWITSIPAHLDAPGFATSLSKARLGHILQLFDTGLPCTQAAYAHIAARLASAGGPFRVGLGAYERGGHEGQHACWAEAARGLESIAGYEGAWIFPAGQDVAGLVAAFTGDRARP